MRSRMREQRPGGVDDYDLHILEMKLEDALQAAREWKLLWAQEYQLRCELEKQQKKNDD